MTVPVLLVDDHRIVRDGIKSVLATAPEFTVVGEAENGQEAIDHALRLHPALILLDISMPGRSGLEILMELRSALPDTKVVMLSMHEEPEYVMRSMKDGAMGYLLKTIEPDEFIHALRLIVSGTSYFQNELAQRVLTTLTRPGSGEKTAVAKTDKPVLTQREKEILGDVAAGLSTKQIASKRFISPRTVEVHRTNLTRKLGAHNTADLIRLAMHYGLLLDSPPLS